jgi:hypothetical protein
VNCRGAARRRAPAAAGEKPPAASAGKAQDTTLARTRTRTPSSEQVRARERGLHHRDLPRRKLTLPRNAVSRGYQRIVKPFDTFAVAGGQKVDDALRNHAA